MTLTPPSHILARSISKGDSIHGRKDQPPIEVLETTTEGRRVKIKLADGGTLTVYGSDMVHVTLAEFAPLEQRMRQHKEAEAEAEGMDAYGSVG